MFHFINSDLEKYRGIKPKFGPVGAVTYKRTYSRPIYEGDTVVDTETWLKTCVRVIEGNMNLVPQDPTATREWALLALDLMYNMAWTPAGRGLWMMGTDYQALRGGDALVNCWYVAVKPQSYEDMDAFKDTYVFSHPTNLMPSFPFVFMFDRAMLGGGVGFGVSKKDISQFSKVNTTVDLRVHLYYEHPDWARIMNSEEWERIKPYTYATAPEVIQPVKSYEPSDTCINVIKIQDSREGWDIAVRELIDAHWSNMGNVKLVIDLSDVRAYGTPIKGFGGTASGPLSLIDALISINNILNSRVYESIQSIDGVDIMNILGRCVVSGNVRRTALVALGEHTDEEYVNAKNYTLVSPIIDTTYGNYGWYENRWGRLTQKLKDKSQVFAEQVEGMALKLNSIVEDHKVIEKTWKYVDAMFDAFAKQDNHRWASNNSVYTDEMFEDFHFISAGIIANGEPGVCNIWLMRNYARIMDGFQEAIDGDVEGGNPCMEISLCNGEPCNLAEVFPYICWMYGYNVHQALQVATMYTYRITFAKYMWKISQRAIEKNRRIGVSLTGMQDYFLAKYNHYALKEFEDGDITKPVFYPEIVQELDSWYKHVEDVNKTHAKAMGAKPSLKKTTNKPSGTTAKVVGVSSGIHWHYAPYLIQRIRFGETDPSLQLARFCGYPVEKDAKVPNTWVVEFPVKAPNADNPNFKSSGNISLEEQFANQFLFAYAWADNAVSATLTFKMDETDKIEPLLRAYNNKIKSTSLLPYSGHGYVQAPWEPISKEEYERRVAEIAIPIEEAYESFKLTATSDLLDSDCSSGACPVR